MSTASELIRKDILAGLESAFKNGALPEIQIDDTAIERPQNPEHGNFACSLPLKLAKPFKMSPLAIAKALAENLPSNGVIGNASVAAPGFINITLDRRWVLNQVHWIRDNPEVFSDIAIGMAEERAQYFKNIPNERLRDIEVLEESSWALRKYVEDMTKRLDYQDKVKTIVTR